MMEGNYMLHTKKDNKTLKISLYGFTDKETEYELEKLVTKNLEGIENLCFDMAELEDISPATVRILNYARMEMKEHGSMIVCNANERVAGLCKLHGIDCR